MQLNKIRNQLINTIIIQITIIYLEKKRNH